MCGRYATTRSGADLSTLFDAIDEAGDLAPDYNVAPTDPVPVVRVSSSRSGARVVAVARWGLLPPWSRDPRAGANMINARAETVATSRAFATSYARRRCLIPADGWYEWLRREGSGGRAGKQAYFMTVPGGGLLAFAGLWTVWGEGPDRLLTCSIVTTPAVGDLALVHDRMPLVLPPERWTDWLAGPAGAPLLAPTPEDFVAGLEIRPVGPAVGDVRNDGPDLVARVPAPPLGAPGGESVPLTLF
ncbi:MAG TPA: SOS response-associated peptidase [Pilimelia sp.]|nr:SOS response-associated peptidase [Pilimelia sp.]